MQRMVVVWSLMLACSAAPARTTTPAPAPAPPVAVPPAVPAAATATPGATTHVVPVVVADDAAPASFRDPDRRKKLEAAFPAIDRAFAEEMKAQGVRGLAFGIVIDGDLAYANGLGVLDPASKQAPDADTVYRIGSITKSFTGLALLSLRDAGAVDLDDPLAKWIPEAAQLVYPSRDERPITLRQLATHTSGLPRDSTIDQENDPSEAALVKSLVGLHLEAAPGERFSYSNLGFGLLGLVVAHAAKVPYQEVIASRIFTPLGMTASTFDPAHVPAGRLAPVQPPPDAPPGPPKLARLGALEGAGAIYSSVRDMAKYVAFQLAAYPPRSGGDDDAIARATVREAHSTGFAAGLRREPPIAAVTYGFGWGASQSCRFHEVEHNGAIDSYRAAIAFLPTRGVGVVVMTNFGNADTGAFIRRALVALDDTGALADRESPPSPQLAEAMTKLLAVYNHWDQAALQAILGRPMDPHEPEELAGYKELHGSCTAFALAHQDSGVSGTFDVTCERGTFQMLLATDPKGQIVGFEGFSRGVAPPPALAKAAQAVIALQARWDDKVYAKYLAKAAPRDAIKMLAAQFHATHGDCKIVAPVHAGVSWGYQLACSKDDVEAYFDTAPGDLTQIVSVHLRPVHGAAPKCE